MGTPVHSLETAGLPDAIIIGGGIGGLIAGVLLADEGKRVLLLEQGNTVGGCAATFTHKGYRFDAGATIGCGFHPGGPMQWLAERLDLQWPARLLPVAWEYCEGNLSLPLDPERESLTGKFPASMGFWKEQAEIADILWKLTALILSQYKQGKLQQAINLAVSLPLKILTTRLIKLSSMSALQWLKQHALESDEKFCRFIDAQLLISAQTTASKCNALFAALALDLPRKSPCIIEGGTGIIAEMISEAIVKRGGRIHLQENVLALKAEKGRIREVVTDKARYSGKEIIVNGSEASLACLLGQSPSSSWPSNSRAKWGAFILHLGLNRDIFSNRNSRHLQIVRNSARTLAESNSLFLSAGLPSNTPRDSEGKKSITVSTHTAAAPWWKAANKGKDEYMAMKSSYTDRMLDLMEEHLGEVRDNIDLCLAGTPLTYARYTKRHLGLVGGYEQTGLFAPRQHSYGLKNCTLVGDYRFPGQSIGGVMTGSTIAVDRVLRRL